MTSPEIINSNRLPRSVDLKRYSLLHPEGRQLISAWFQRVGERETVNKMKPFIFARFAFNGWAACVTDTDRDQEIINALAADILFVKRGEMLW